MGESQQNPAPPPPPPPPIAGTPSQSGSAMKPPASKNQAVQPSINPDNMAEGLPNEDILNENTLEAEPNPQVIGDFTNQLSDVSDGEADNDKRTVSRNALSTWYRRIQPLIRNKRVRAFAIVNTILTIINLLLFIGCLVMLALLIVEAVSVKKRSEQDKPCIYQWTDWSPCNATCAPLDGVTHPMKTRTIKKGSIIQARGDKYKACPKDLAERVDYAPCNTHTCPKKLSSFTNWTNCFLNDVTDEAQGCYEMRDLPIGDYLIEIDTTELTRKCRVNCSQAVNKF